MLKHIGDYKVGKYGRHYMIAVPSEARQRLQFNPDRLVRIYMDETANALVYSFAVPTVAKGKPKRKPKQVVEPIAPDESDETPFDEVDDDPDD